MAYFKSGPFLLPSSYLKIHIAGARVIVNRLYFAVMSGMMLRSSQKQKLRVFHVVLDNCHPNNNDNNNDNFMAWGCFTVLTPGTVEK